MSMCQTAIRIERCFAGGLVAARDGAGPGGQVPGGAEPAHVRAGFGDDDLGPRAADAGDRLQRFKGHRERAHRLLNALGELQDRGVDLVNALQMDPAQSSAAHRAYGNSMSPPGPTAVIDRVHPGNHRAEESDLRARRQRSTDPVSRSRRQTSRRLDGTIEKPASRTDATPVFPPHGGQHSGLGN